MCVYWVILACQPPNYEYFIQFVFKASIFLCTYTYSLMKMAAVAMGRNKVGVLERLDVCTTFLPQLYYLTHKVILGIIVSYYCCIVVSLSFLLLTIPTVSGNSGVNWIDTIKPYILDVMCVSSIHQDTDI